MNCRIIVRSLSPLLLVPLCFTCSQKAPPSGLGIDRQEPRQAVNGSLAILVSNFVPCEWYPLVDGAVHEYRGTFNNEVYEQSALTRRVALDPGFVFVSTDPIFLGQGGDSIGSYSLMWGPVFSGTSGIWVGDTHWNEDMPNMRIDELILGVRLPATPGDVVEIVDEGLTTSFTVENREDVEVPAGRFPNCVKIRRQQQWPDEGSTAFFWFADGVGLVRYVRNTGRVDELVAFDIPGSGRSVEIGEKQECLIGGEPDS